MTDPEPSGLHLRKTSPKMAGINRNPESVQRLSRQWHALLAVFPISWGGLYLTFSTRKRQNDW